MKRFFGFTIVVALGATIFFPQISCSKKTDELGALRVAVTQGPVSLDPRVASDAEGIKVARLISDGLFSMNEALEIVPNLAEKVEKLSDTSYRFTLRKGVKFHDGSDLTAEDVAYTYNSIREGEVASPFRGAFERVKDISVESPDVLKIDLTEPYSPFTTALLVGIVPSSAKGRAAEFSKSPVGTGPYKFLYYNQDTGLMLDANPNYFGNLPAISKLYFDIVKDDNVRVMKILKGDDDLVQNSVPPVLLDKLRADPNLSVKEGAGIVMTYMGLNLTDPILSNPLVRRAIAHAIDRDAVISHRFRGLADKANSILSPKNWAYNASLTQYEFDPSKAKALLDEAGFKDPDGDGPKTRFDLVYKTSSSKERIDTAQMIALQLAHVGIGARVEPYEWGKLYDDIKKGNFQMYTMSWSLLTEPDMFYDICNSAEHAPKGVNRSRYSNARVDAMTNEARRTFDPARRKELYAEVQKIVLDELPFIPLWHEKNVVVYRNNLKNVSLRPDASYNTFADITGDGREIAGDGREK